jgi:AraC-like DNA-binding protein
MTVFNDVANGSRSVGASATLKSTHAVDTAPDFPLSAGYLRLGPARDIPATLRELGIDPEPVVRAAGLDPRQFEDENSVVPHDAVGRLYALSVARTRCFHFGLLVGQQATIRSLGISGLLMLHSTTVGDALRSLVAHFSTQNRSAIVALGVRGDIAIFSYAVYQPNSESTDQIADVAIACVTNALRALLGSEWNPVEVLLPRKSPVDAASFRRHFRAPVRFNQEMAAIVLSARDLERPISNADPVVRALLQQRVLKLKGNGRSELVDEVRRLLRRQLMRERCSAQEVARMLAMHRRTLNRRLNGSGKTYRAISDEVHFEMARQLLQDTQIPLCQISAALGFSEASAFTRAFRRWSGCAPSAWRKDEGRSRTAKPRVNISEVAPSHSRKHAPRSGYQLSALSAH